MTISIFEIFSVGIGPSSSHTVGPMRAAKDFVSNLEIQNNSSKVKRLLIELYGSLALTGKGHNTDKAILLGLEGALPETVDPDTVNYRVDEIISKCVLNLNEKNKINFIPERDLLWHKDATLILHSNGMRFTAIDKDEKILQTEVYYSTGGGFISREADLSEKKQVTLIEKLVCPKSSAHGCGCGSSCFAKIVLKKVPFPFSSAKELFAHCKRENLLVKDIALSNEEVFLSREEIYARLHAIGDVMTKSIEKGCSTYGVLPGGLGLNRRAPKLYAEVTRINNINDHSVIFNCINAYALAVAEENANGGRIITAPTNGSAGVLPAVFEYYRRFYPKKYKPEDVCDFLLTAGAIAILYKLNASISGAEVGCQGEIGVACSMAAGALVAVLGGNNRQIEKAAEIGMEHNLGLTCDPVDGLVQIPCIERNAIGAIKAIDAALLGLAEGDNEHKVSLDTMIQTMYCTGKDMMPQYKETSTGGLAICFPLGLSE